jgi:hypothetical protein
MGYVHYETRVYRLQLDDWRLLAVVA